MGIEDKHIGGLVFVACMFIGAGIGLIFGRPDAGGAIGMGVGFMLMAILRRTEIKRVELTVPRTLPSLVLIVIGLLTIVVGLALLYAPEIIYPYLAGIAALVIGALILTFGLVTLVKK